MYGPTHQRCAALVIPRKSNETSNKNSRQKEEFHRSFTRWKWNSILRHGYVVHFPTGKLRKTTVAILSKITKQNCLVLMFFLQHGWLLFLGVVFHMVLWGNRRRVFWGNRCPNWRLLSIFSSVPSRVRSLDGTNYRFNWIQEQIWRKIYPLCRWGKTIGVLLLKK